MAAEISKIYHAKVKAEMEQRAREKAEFENTVACEAVKLYELFKERARVEAANGLQGIIIMPATYERDVGTLAHFKVPISEHGYVQAKSKSLLGRECITTSMTKALDGLLLLLEKDGFRVKKYPQKTRRAGRTYLTTSVCVRWDTPLSPSPSAPPSKSETAIT